MEELAYWIGFNRVMGIGAVRLKALLDHFDDDVEAAWFAGATDLLEAGLDRRSVSNLLLARQQMDLQAQIDQLKQSGVTALTWQCEEYPINLRNIEQPPPVLYIKGELIPEDDWAVAVVGTRRASVYGKEVARRLASDLVRNGITVVSGLATGIDSMAHRAAVDVGGRTLAVLGSGVDVIYPANNRQLATAIQEQGALISEFPLGTHPERRNFPPRNRIISGLSLGTVVVEAGVRSGALITVKSALDQGRDVFAVPGSILQKSCEGSNRLLRDGARPVLSVEDILEELHLAKVTQQAEVRAAVPTTFIESTLLGHLSGEPTYVDELSRLTDLPAATIASTLTVLELKGLVRQVGGMSYIQVRDF
ncbi:MAG: DNA-processing protein DprA [Chloroflexota bacterium]|nr:DNA-processing protein DprA [Chloroflexota bacterium]